MSKGLKALEELRKQSKTHDWLEQQFEKEWLNTIEQELKEKEELEKLLEHERELNNHLIIHEFKALKKIKALEILKLNTISSLELKWDGERWTISTPVCPYPIGYGNKKEDYDLLREVLLCEINEGK